MIGAEQITAWSALFFSIGVVAFQVGLWYAAQGIYWAAGKYLTWSAKREKAKAESAL